MAKTKDQLLAEIEAKFGPRIAQKEPAHLDYLRLTAKRDDLVRDVVARFDALAEIERLQSSVPAEPEIVVP